MFDILGHLPYHMIFFNLFPGIASTAHAYNEALRRVGFASKTGKGGTEEIGRCTSPV